LPAGADSIAELLLAKSSLGGLCCASRISLGSFPHAYTLRWLKTPTFYLATGFWFSDFRSELLPEKRETDLPPEEKTKEGLVVSARIGGNEVGFCFRVCALLLEEIAV
jgi:hypothetical protein